MPENLLGLLKLCLLALLYLFFIRVLWTVWAEVRGPRAAKAAPVDASGQPKAKAKLRGRTAAAASRLVVEQPSDRKGTVFDIGPEVTVGRAAGCQVALPDDTYVSQLHARVFNRSGQVYVEDLGSTNGTYVNGHRVTAPTPMHRGDSLQVGSTIMEVT